MPLCGCIGGEEEETTTPPPTTTAAPTTTSPPTTTAVPTTTNPPTTQPPEDPVEILSYTGVKDDYGYYTIYGEVQNNLGYNLEYVKIVASYYDNRGQFLGSSFTFTEMDILKPGQKSPFELSSFPDTFTPSEVELQVTYSRAYSKPFEGITILNHSGKSSTYGCYEVIGQVQNNSNVDASYVKIVCTYYNGNGKVIGCAFCFTDIDTLRPGQKSPFELTSYPLEITPAYYELQVQASNW